LLREEVDLVISSNPEPLGGITFHPLFDYHPTFVASSRNPLAAKAVIEAEDFREQTLITYPVGRDKLDIFTELLTEARVEPRAQRAVELTAVILMLVGSDRGVAVLPVSGALMMNPDLWSMLIGQAEDLELLTEQVQKMAADPEVGAAILRLDTPGGMMTGGIELADAVAELTSRKPVIAWTGSLCASLGYLVASQASEIVATRSAQVGSIGTILSVMDWTEYLKGLGVKIHTFTNKEGSLKSILPMNEERSAYLQGRADSAFAMFRDMVKAKRPDVKDGTMKGQIFTAGEAQSLGLVDRIGDFNFALGLARQMARARSRSGS
jgi:signal peptide peptidase SppA